MNGIQSNAGLRLFETESSDKEPPVSLETSLMVLGEQESIEQMWKLENGISHRRARLVSGGINGNST